MKKITFIVTVLFLLSASVFAAKDTKITGYLGVGGTSVDLGTTLENTSGVDVNKLNVRLGAQVIVGVSDRIGLGVDLSAISLWKWNFGSLTGARARMFGMLGVLELNITEGLFFQLGGGYYISYSDNASSTTVAGGVDNGPGFMAALGYGIKINDNLSLPIMLRTDFIFADVQETFSIGKVSKTIIPVSLVVGISYKI